MTTNNSSSSDFDLGDAAVDGLFAGAAAGLGMAILVVLIGVAQGIHPYLTLAQFNSNDSASPVIGGLTHLAASTVYGIIFGIIRRAIPSLSGQNVWLMGIIYGIALFVLARWLLLPVTSSALNAMPIWELLVAHAIYGLLLGRFLQK